MHPSSLSIGGLPSLLGGAEQMKLILVVQMHVGPETVLVPVLALADRTDDLDATLVRLAVVPTDVHIEGVDVLQLLPAELADGPARKAFRDYDAFSTSRSSLLLLLQLLLDQLLVLQLALEPLERGGGATAAT